MFVRAPEPRLTVKADVPLFFILAVLDERGAFTDFAFSVGGGGAGGGGSASGCFGDFGIHIILLYIWG